MGKFLKRRWVRVTIAISIAVVVLICGFLGGLLVPRPAASPISPLPPARYLVTVKQDIAYGPLGDQGEKLDVCTPTNLPGAHPGLVLIHGGGWFSGDKHDFLDLCRYFASQGIVSATINYRLGPTHQWPAQINDAQLAVRWLRTHASDYALDPERLCAFGGSAGAHLAAYLGAMHTIHPGDQASELTSQPPDVSCVVDWAGPVDLAKLPETDTKKQAFSALFGPIADPAAVHDASPLFLISAKSAPTLIIQGTKDPLVAPDQAHMLKEALENVGVYVEEQDFEGTHDISSIDATQQLALLTRSLIFLLIYG